MIENVQKISNKTLCADTQMMPTRGLLGPSLLLFLSLLSSPSSFVAPSQTQLAWKREEEEEEEEEEIVILFWGFVVVFFSLIITTKTAACLFSKGDCIRVPPSLWIDATQDGDYWKNDPRDDEATARGVSG